MKKLVVKAVAKGYTPEKSLALGEGDFLVDEVDGEMLVVSKGRLSIMDYVYLVNELPGGEKMWICW
jgi:hypothetical protein